MEQTRAKIYETVEKKHVIRNTASRETQKDPKRLTNMSFNIKPLLD